MDELLEDEGGGDGEPLQQWSDDDKALLAPCIGLIKVISLLLSSLDIYPIITAVRVILMIRFELST